MKDKAVHPAAFYKHAASTFPFFISGFQSPHAIYTALSLFMVLQSEIRKLEFLAGKGW
jgi:hypothetical protein